MGQYDKDRFQKEIALRYCLSRGMIPFLEVLVSSTSDLSKSPEVLTDLDVVGVETFGDGGLRRTIFDCKTTNKMSSINRAFWAGGVKQYTNCDDAYVILKSKAVHNHRVSALSIGVDLHDEESFKDLGRTADPAFPADTFYQSSVDRWNQVYRSYSKNKWSVEMLNLVRNQVPLTRSPASIFRRIVAELRQHKGEVDPNKPEHVAIFFDILSSLFVLWAAMGRDVRRFYEPSMDKKMFTEILRYYIWGGKEAYSIRQQLNVKLSSQTGSDAKVDLPAWNDLVSFAGVIIASPGSILSCSHLCREMSIRTVSEITPRFDEQIKTLMERNNRLRQFTVSLSDYLVNAAGLPNDMQKIIEGELFGL